MKPTHLLLGLGLLAPAIALANDRPRPPAPPQEAIDACAERAAGDACAFDHGDHHVTGTCFSPDEDRPLACKPDHPPPCAP